MSKISSFFEVFKWFIVISIEVSRNIFRFLPFVGPKKYLGQKRLDNKVVIVTGGNSGIGKATARELALRGAKVIIGCRDEKRGQAAADEINDEIQMNDNGCVVFKQLDLASFESIRKFANEINEEEEAIDILVNNAGVFFTPKNSLTKDGFELHFGVKYLGHFLLTLLLLEKLKMSNAISRIISVASHAYFFTNIQFDDLNLELNYTKSRANAQSQLAIVLFIRELAKRLHGTNIRTYSLHPGIVKTNLFRYDKFVRNILKIVFPMTISPKLGCQTTLYCALDDDVANESGNYYSNCTKFVNEKCAVTNYIANNGCDDVTAEKLWNLSLDLVKLESNYKI